MTNSKWQISDELWEKMAPLFPEHKKHYRWVRIASGLIIVPQ
ncbi:hypothetical protein SEEERB17_000945 [Salmonella enterica subsp. enterica serovar Enteritidis str. SARB17]|nr:hypothetical protein SEEERB17_000945 [Salmonella enterica subsp. enterica serovar Enteritidis str. SARB17]